MAVTAVLSVPPPVYYILSIVNLLMARKRRGGKGARKRHRRKGRKKRSFMSRMVTLCRMKGAVSQSVFPPELRTVLTVAGVTGTGPQAGNTSYLLGWYANAFGNGATGTAGVGPQVNAAGAFATNYPTGLYYLLAQPLNNYAQAPYAACRVLNATFKFRAIPAPITAGQRGCQMIRLAYLPTIQPSILNLPIISVLEQPRAREHLMEYPVRPDGGISYNGVPKWHTMKMNVARAFGIPPQSILNDTGFLNTPTNVNAQPAYFYISIAGDGSVTGGDNYNVTIEWEIHYDTVFNARNNIAAIANR